MVLTITFYKSEILHQGLNRDQYIIYYVFSFSFIISIICIQLFNSKIKKNFYIILLSCLTGLAIFETSLEFKFDKIVRKNVSGKI